MYRTLTRLNSLLYIYFESLTIEFRNIYIRFNKINPFNQPIYKDLIEIEFKHNTFYLKCHFIILA